LDIRPDLNIRKIADAGADKLIKREINSFNAKLNFVIFINT